MAVDAAADASEGLNKLHMAAPEACMSHLALKSSFILTHCNVPTLLSVPGLPESLKLSCGEVYNVHKGRMCI